MKWMLSQHAPDCCVRELNPPFLTPEAIPLNDFYLPGIISLRISVSSIETYATTFERVKRISRDCSSLEWIGKESNLTTWNNGSLSIHKLCPLCASYPFEYYPPFGSINRLTQTQEPFVPRKHVTSDNMFFRCFSACTSTAHFLSARAVQGQPISPIRASCATTYRISILMVLMSFP